MKKRLSKALQAAGVASRRASEELIFDGRCRVNGEVVLKHQTMVDPQRDRILVDRKQIKKEERKVYFLLNKPAGYLCSNTRISKRTRLVIDIFAHMPYRLFTVGRLDRETKGLLLITNDGEIANRVIHPSFNISKEYVAKTEEEITDEHLKILSAGTLVENSFVKPVSVSKVRRGTVKIVVKEGKKHEVRLLLQAAALTVKELCRVRIGPLTLSSLEEGDYRPLTESEIDFFL